MHLPSALGVLGGSHPAPRPDQSGVRASRGDAPAIVKAILYMDGVRRPAPPSLRQAWQAAIASGGFVWLGLHEPTPQEFARVAEQFELPALAVEDAILAHQRPKLEKYGDLVFAVIKPARYVDTDEVIEIGELAVFISRHLVVTVRHGESGIPAQARAALEAAPDKLASGPGAVLHELLDRVVDEYLEVIEAVEVDIDQIEAEVFSGDHLDHSERIYKLKREVLEFRRAVGPLLGPLDRLGSQDILGVGDAERLHFRDVHDHALRAADVLDSYDALLTGVLQADLAQVSVRQNQVAVRQNEDMRKISAWAAIGLVPTAIAGVYGMNFDHMPELRWQYGYFMVVGLIVTVCTGLYAMFRRNGWL